MERVCLDNHSYEEYVTSKEILGAGFEAKVYSLDEEVLKIYTDEFLTSELEKRINALGDTKGLKDIITIPTKSLYLNMSFVGFFMNYAGIDLKKYLKEKEISFEEKIRILCLVKEKLEYLHKMGIVHGDLQPKNIMVYKSDVKIGDVANMLFANYHDILLNDMTLYLSKYFGVSSLLDLHSLNYITYILLNMDREESLEYLELDALGYSYLIENGVKNKVFQDDIFKEQMDILLHPKENKDYALERSKYLIDYIR